MSTSSHTHTLTLRQLLCAALLLLSLLGTSAQACSGAETGGNLGTVSSQRISAGTSVTTTGTFSFNCSSTLLAIGPAPTLTGTLQSNVTGLTLKNTSNSAITIPYQLYSNSGNTTTYTGGAVVVSLNGITLLSVLNAAGAASTVPISIGTTPGAVVPAGTYTDTVQVTWAYANICEGLLSVGGGCLGVPNTGNTPRSMVITLVVTNDCTIDARAVDFSSAPLVSGFAVVPQSVNLVCSKGMTYTVGMSTSSNAVNGHRAMASGAQRLEYDIFKADSTVWGKVGTARANVAVPADGVNVQSIPYTAKIYTTQTTPPVGTYTDNVVVDVEF